MFVITPELSNLYPQETTITFYINANLNKLESLIYRSPKEEETPNDSYLRPINLISKNDETGLNSSTWHRIQFNDLLQMLTFETALRGEYQCAINILEDLPPDEDHSRIIKFFESAMKNSYKNSEVLESKDKKGKQSAQTSSAGLYAKSKQRKDINQRSRGAAFPSSSCTIS